MRKTDKKEEMSTRILERMQKHPSLFSPLSAILLCATLLTTGCSKETITPPVTGNEISFKAGITNRVTLDGTWETGNKIGIYACKGEEIPHPNKQYQIINASNGTMGAVATTDKIPHSGNTLNFYAYSPYNGTVTGTTCKIKITDQSSTEKVLSADLLWAKAENMKSQNVTLQFSPKLARLNFTVMIGHDEMIDVNSLKATLKGANSTADFDIKTGTFSNLTTDDISLNVVVNNSDKRKATVTALVIPTENLSECKLIIEGPNGKGFVWKPTDIKWDSSEKYDYEVLIGKGSFIEYATIKAGKFWMGSPSGEADRALDETRHEVTLSKDFKMSKYEITNAQYCMFLNENKIGSSGKWEKATVDANQILVYDPSKKHRYLLSVTWDTKNNKWVPIKGKENHPVVYVTWYGAKEFAVWAGGDLPTEAQWEYACRAGTETTYSFGPDATHMDAHCWYKSNSSSVTQIVGSKKPNAFGLYDMYGNVWEWCRDFNGPYNTNSGAVTDPAGPASGSARILRGGSWNNVPSQCRSASRYSKDPAFDTFVIGFRIVI